jgi:DNA-damage-inducible protein J
LPHVATLTDRTKREAASEKALPFEPLNPNAETVAAMKAARRGELVKAGKPHKLLRSLNAGR